MVNLQDKPIVVSSPVEVEKALDAIRVELATLPWVSHPYFIAQRFFRRENSKSFYYPETYAGKVNGAYDYHPLTPDNDYTGMFFFYVSPERTVFNHHLHTYLVYDVAIIFSCNLSLIDDAKLVLGLYTQELVKDVRRLLITKMPSFDFEYKVESITRDLQEVYREFTLDDIEQYNRAPLQCFRVNLELKILEECT